MELDPAQRTLALVVETAADRFGDGEALSDTQDAAHVVRLDFRQLLAEVDETAAALVASGRQPGDVVALWAPNTWEWVVAAFAVFRAGCVLVPVNTRFKGREAAYVLRKSRARMLFTVNGFLDTDYVGMLGATTAEPGEALPDLDEIVVLRGDAVAGTVSCADLLSRADDEARTEVPRRAHAVEADDTGLVMFTSGTTGLPKGVMVAHGAVCRMSTIYGSCLGITAGERHLVISPFFHAFGFNGGIVPSLLYGATILPHAVFDTVGVLEKIGAEHVNVMPGAPAIFQSLLNHPDLDRYDVSSLRRCVTGAATIPEEMVNQMRQRLGFETIITAYGMTETSGLATICRPDDDVRTIATTSGRAAPGVSLRVVDEDEREVAVGTPGELWVSGWCVMKGYLDDPEQTAATITPDGWLRTGDIVVMDERGYIDITDRKKDMFIVGGFNAYPAEIERMMLVHSGVGQVSVVGVPDERLGEVGTAFVVPAPGERPTEGELLAWCREQMANYKVPRRVWFVDALPMNASNKVLKADLRAAARQRLSEPAEPR